MGSKSQASVKRKNSNVRIRKINNRSNSELLSIDHSITFNDEDSPLGQFKVVSEFRPLTTPNMNSNELAFKEKSSGPKLETNNFQVSNQKAMQNYFKPSPKDFSDQSSIDFNINRSYVNDEQLQDNLYRSTLRNLLSNISIKKQGNQNNTETNSKNTFYSNKSHVTTQDRQKMNTSRAKM